MKNAFIISLFFLTSCITINTTSTGFKDEIYYSEDDYISNENDQTNIVSEQDLNQTEDESEEVYVDEYSSDDYYDYGYSSRIRRFHNPYFGFSYYNNYYTNSYWYDYNPYNYGVSIYYGYSFWHPHHYHPYGYHHHYSGFHDYYYYNSYYAGLTYPTYFNSYDNNSVYYGVRQNYNIQKTPDSFANRFINEKLKNPVINKPQLNKKPKLPSSINSRPQNNLNTNSNINYSKPSKPQNNINQNSINKKPLNTKPIYNSKPSQTTKPSNNYKKPVYNKPIRNNSFKSPSVRPSNSRGPSRTSTPRPR